MTYFRELRGELGAFEDRNGVTAEPDHIVYLVREREEERESQNEKEKRNDHTAVYNKTARIRLGGRQLNVNTFALHSVFWVER